MELLLNKLDALVSKLEKAGGKGSQAANDIGSQAANDIRAQLNNIKKGKLDGLASVVESLEEKADDSAGASALSGSVDSFNSILSGSRQQLVEMLPPWDTWLGQHLTSRNTFF